MMNNGGTENTNRNSNSNGSSSSSSRLTSTQSTRGFYEYNSPSLVGTQTEGGSTLFKVDYFGKPMFLTQTWQLHAEPGIFSLEKIFTIQPSFRAEKSRTSRHLTEYWHAEMEAAWEDFDYLKDDAEKLVKYVVKKVLEKNKIENKFKQLKPIQDYFSVDNIFSTLEKSKIENGITVYIFGKGKVSKGVQEILKYSSIKANVLYRNKTAHVEKYLPKADIIVNAIDWYPNEPHIIKRSMLKLMKKTAVIVDISCDQNGGIETCIPTTWEKPTYETDGITHFCVDNLPSVIPRDASMHLSEMIIPHVIKVAEGKGYANGLMTKDGVFEYSKKKAANKKFEKELLVVEETA